MTGLVIVACLILGAVSIVIGEGIATVGYWRHHSLMSGCSHGN